MAQPEFDLAWDQVKVLAERRQNATTAYVSINTAVAAAMALMFKDGALAGPAQHAAVLLLLLTAGITCHLWRQHVQQYREILGWWYGRLRKMEDPRAKLIDDEYKELYRRPDQPLESNRFETALTWLFTILYACFAGVVAYQLHQLIVSPSKPAQSGSKQALTAPQGKPANGPNALPTRPAASRP